MHGRLYVRAFMYARACAIVLVPASCMIVCARVCTRACVCACVFE